MPDIFISYSTSDAEAARFIHRNLVDQGVSVFLAAASLQLGQQWSPDTLEALRGADCVLFLASRSACASPWVQQELGYAIGAKKKLIPIIWDMKPTELPGWVSGYQALDLAHRSAQEVKQEVAAIAARIKADKHTVLLIAGFALAALFLK
ncbi:toll/interleukin-1 receptor domain-containing protein [Zoogloea sp.]|uniref:toll/interleukin-1 receptor domain-containing protein n=1 Tax=Zoogloea sp. TaxID=49181 RepID=UPI0035ADEB7A